MCGILMWTMYTRKQCIIRGILLNEKKKKTEVIVYTTINKGKYRTKTKRGKVIKQLVENLSQR